MRISVWLILSILNVVCAFGIIAYFYPLLSNQIAMHFDYNGEADAFYHKGFLFAFPIIMIALVALFQYLPTIDAHKENYDKFAFYYGLFQLAIQLFFNYLIALLILKNLRPSMEFLTLFMPGFSGLMIVCGISNMKSKRTSYFGVRTTWTLSSDIAWEQLNYWGGIVFISSGIIGIGGVLISKWLMLFSIVELILGFCIIVLYGYCKGRGMKETKTS